MKKLRKNLGKKLKGLREAAGKSQSFMAKDAGYTTPQFVSNVERGIIPPSPKYIITLARHTATTRSEMVGMLSKLYVARVNKEIKRYAKL